MKLLISPKRFLTGFSIVGMVFISIYSYTKSGGADPGYAHAPPSPANCTSCHSGSLIQTGTQWNKISLTGDFNGTGGYTPDSTYTMTLKYVHINKSKFGFQVTALHNDGPADSMAGHLNINTGATRKTTNTVNGQTREYITHSSSGNSGTDSIEWTFSWTAPSRTVGPVKFYVALNSANGDGGNGGDQIYAKQFSFGVSNLLTEAEIDADTNIICYDASLQFYGSGTKSPTGYKWTFPSGASPQTSTAQNPVVSFNFLQGTFPVYLETSNALGTGRPDTFNVTIRPNVSAFINGNANRKICKGDSVLLSLNAVSGITYTWPDGSTGSSFMAKDSGDYFVIAQRNGCEKKSNVIRVDFQDIPIATLTSDAASFGDSACTNSMITLKGNSGYDSSYFYANGNLLNVTADSIYTANFVGQTTFGLQVKSSQGCLSEIDEHLVYEIQRNTAPTITCDSSSSNSVQFAWTDPNSSIAFEVSVDSGQNWIAASSGVMGTEHLIENLQPEQKTQLWVRSFDDAPCNTSMIAKKVCFSDTCNSINVTIQAPDAVCFGNSAAIEVNGLADASYALFFESGTAFKDTVFNFTPDRTKSYLIEIQDSNYLECPLEMIEIPVRVDSVVGNSLSFTPNLICRGDQISIDAVSEMDDYSFVINGTTVSTGIMSSYVTDGLEYGDSAYVIVEKGVCTEQSATVAIPVFETADASFTFVRTGPNYTFTPNNLQHSIYTWDFGDGNTSSDQLPVHDYSAKEGQSVKTKLTVTDENSCVEADSQNISVPDMTSIDVLNSFGINIYPNPVQDFIVIEKEVKYPVEIKLVSIDGKTIETVNMLSNKITLDMSDIESGVYFLDFTIDGKSYSQRVLKN